MGIHIFNRFDRFLSSLEMFLSPFNETATVKFEPNPGSNCVHRKYHSTFRPVVLKSKENKLTVNIY